MRHLGKVPKMNIFKFGMLFTVMSLFSAQASMAVKFYTTGSTSDVVKATSSGVCLAGGGSDDAWAGGWNYLLQRANGGDVVIIRADGRRGGYESWIYNDDDQHGFPKVNSVQTILMTRAADANRADVEDKINKAELIFFAGGDQSIYISWFRNSRLAAAVDHAMKVRKVPVGGTSAGMALLAGIDFTAAYSSPSVKKGMVTSDDVMKDPTGTFVDLDRSVLIPPFLSQVITDSHFSARNRQGRLVGFMARAVYNNYGDINYSNIKAIAADEGTAFCYEGTGKGKVFGAGNAFFLKGNAPIERILQGTSLDWYASRQAVDAYVISGSSAAAEFDLLTWTGSGGISQYWWVNGSNPAAPFFGIN